MTNQQQPTTHERYLHAVRDAVIARAVERQTITGEQGARLSHTKLLYGVGDGTYRGVTVFDAWENGVGRVDIVEVAATGQESWIQLAGAVIHEMGHVQAGMDAGHSNQWKDAAAALDAAATPPPRPRQVDRPLSDGSAAKWAAVVFCHDLPAGAAGGGLPRVVFSGTMTRRPTSCWIWRRPASAFRQRPGAKIRVISEDGPVTLTFDFVSNRINFAVSDILWVAWCSFP